MSSDDGSYFGRIIAGKFVLEAVLGEGGTGTVYRARQLALDRTVALKLLRREIARDEHFLERFKREARAASRLDHPNSVRVLDFGQDHDSSLYLVMELVQGRTLYEIIDADWPLENARVVRLLSQVLAALAVAHELGVIHRDLKPENIIVVRTTGDDGEDVEHAKVCDFGIAALGARLRSPAGTDERRVTLSGSFVGTPEYMSPEQVRGELGDQRSDLYSLGVVLYQLLTGRLPFRDPSPWTVALLHNTEPPPPPSTLLHVHPGLEAVCLKAMSKQPEHRFDTAREMRAALRACLNRDGIPTALTPAPVRIPTATPMAVSPVGARNTVVLQRGRRRPWLAVAGVVGLALASALAGRLAGRPHLPPAPVITAHVPAAIAAAPALPLPPPEPPAAAPEPPAPPAFVGPPLPPQRPARVVRSRPTVRRAPSMIEPAPALVAAEPLGPSLPPEPSAPPPPAPPAHPIAPTPPRPRWDPQRASVTITAVTSTSAVPGANIRAALGRLPLLRCYRTLGGPAATATLRLKIDEAGYVTAATLEGDLPGELRACVEKSARALRIKDVDTGDAAAAVTLRFTPS
jgi:serine/threonine-protein kinase